MPATTRAPNPKIGTHTTPTGRRCWPSRRFMRSRADCQECLVALTASPRTAGILARFVTNRAASAPGSSRPSSGRNGSIRRMFSSVAYVVVLVWRPLVVVSGAAVLVTCAHSLTCACHSTMGTRASSPHVRLPTASRRRMIASITQAANSTTPVVRRRNPAAQAQTTPSRVPTVATSARDWRRQRRRLH